MGANDTVFIDLCAMLPEQLLHQPVVSVGCVVQRPVFLQQFMDRSSALPGMALAHQHRGLVIEQRFAGELLR
ncbi:hypothetical protein D9M69_497270 [compost metagenome]